MPPKYFHKFFRWYCHPRLRDHIEGDLIEFYQERSKKSKRMADFRFIVDVLLLFRPAIIRPVKAYNRTFMFRNYFTIGWRTLMRDKGYSAINIGGLTAGMAVAILIGMWIFDELSYNKSFENYDRIGHVMVHNGDGTYPSNPIPLVAELRANFSQDIKYVSICAPLYSMSITSGENKFMDRSIYVDPEAADMFSLNMVHGTRRALTEANTIVISESLSKKLFAGVDPIGQVVRLKNLIDVRVGGVYKDFPANNEFSTIGIIGSWQLLRSWMTWIQDLENKWDNNSYKIYVELNEGVNFDELSAKIKDLKRPHLDTERLKYNPELFVNPMSKWHLYSTFKNRQRVISEPLQFVWLYGIIGIFVLILACINFMNLSTARSGKRAKEVGIRKTMGSLRLQLIVQFMSESFITVLIAAAGSIVLVLLALPYFNHIALKEISFPWDKSMFWIAIFAFVFVAGLMAGSYPALYLSSFKPVKVLKARLTSLPRKILVVVQFTVSVSLIVGTIVVYQQIQFAKDRPVGYTRNGLVTVFMVTPDLFRRYDVIRNELLQSGAVENVSNSSAPVTDIWSNSGGFEWDGKPAALETNFAMNWVSGPYGKTVGWQFIQGRDFSEDIASDSAAVVINKTLAKFLAFEDPLDKELRWDGHKLRIVGVIEDMVMGSPYEEIMPTLFRNSKENQYVINIRLNPSLGAAEAIDRITAIFQKHNPSVPFQYNFVDDEYANKFATEMRVGKLALIFAALAIMISLLGLFGLSSFVAEQRTKEIGIRKVVGASILNLWGMLTKSFVILVGLSCLIAFPLAWYFLTNWLTRFQYRTEIQWWIFPVVITGALAITLITVSYQAIRAAMINPVESLKSE